MENDTNIIDALEKLKAFLFTFDPEVERIRDNLLSDRLRLDSPDFIMESYLAAHLNIRFETSETRRRIHKLLSNIRDESFPSVSMIQRVIISDSKMDYIRRGLHSLDDLIHQDVLKKELRTGIQNALIRLNLAERLNLRGMKIYRFLSMLGAPVAVGSPAKYRFLARLDWIKNNERGMKALQEYHSFCEKVAGLTGESVPIIDYFFSLFSMKGRKNQTILPVCGSKPKCDLCVLSPYCNYSRLLPKSKKTEDSTLPLYQWNKEDRPREQLEQRGTDNLSDTQLLAIILRTGVEKCSAVDLARNLLTRFETLRSLEEASLIELCSIRGIGKVKAIQIKAALELGKRSIENLRKDKTIILESLDVFRQYRYDLVALKQESFFLLILNSRNQVMKKIEISRGTLDASIVHPREVFRAAIKESASSVIFFHNHPSGDPNPSRADNLITERLKKSGEVLGIKVLDHIIIGNDSYYSFADEGLL